MNEQLHNCTSMVLETKDLCFLITQGEHFAINYRQCSEDSIGMKVCNDTLHITQTKRVWSKANTKPSLSWILHHPQLEITVPVLHALTIHITNGSGAVDDLVVDTLEANITSGSLRMSQICAQAVQLVARASSIEVDALRCHNTCIAQANNGRIVCKHTALDNAGYCIQSINGRINIPHHTLTGMHELQIPGTPLFTLTAITGRIELS